eukprot:COSAG01_NODE_3299_length_6296_cov_243.565112_8_plen_45_part_00
MGEKNFKPLVTKPREHRGEVTRGGICCEKDENDDGIEVDKGRRS